MSVPEGLKLLKDSYVITDWNKPTHDTFQVDVSGGKLFDFHTTVQAKQGKKIHIPASDATQIGCGRAAGAAFRQVFPTGQVGLNPPG